jgi:hypothetical protein
MRFKRIRVPGEEQIRPAELIGESSLDWREKLR